MKFDKDLMKGSTKMLILNLLSTGDMYGYQMVKELEERSDSTFTLKEGTMYPILHSLESDGMVEAYWEESDSGRKRKYYQITSSGRKLLEEKKKEWALYSSTVNKVIGGLALNKYVSIFLDKVCEEIKYKGVHSGISEELESHVNERIDYYVEAGLTEKEASIKAVEQMGDPVKIGQELNKTHRPKTEWSIIGLIGVMVIMGIISVYTLAMDQGYYLSTGGLLGKYLSYIIVGLVVFLALYYFDYKKAEKYSLHILIGTLVVLLISDLLFFSNRLGTTRTPLHSIALPLLIVSFAGLMKRWCNVNGKDMFKLLGLVMITTIFLLTFTDSLTITAGLLLTIFISITISIINKGFKGNGKKWLMLIYGSATSGIFLVVNFILRPWQVERLKVVLNPEEYATTSGWLILQVRDLLSNAKFWGQSASLHHTFEGVDRIYLPSAETDLIFTYIISAFGWAMGMAVILVIAAVIYRMYLASTKIRDEYGKILAISVITIFSMQTISSILMNLGIFPIVGVSLPFMSQGGTNFVINMVLMGLLLGIYRRKDLVVVSNRSYNNLT